MLLFVRDPVPGKVKTRLAAEIGDDAALALYRTLARNIAHGLGERPGWKLQVQVAASPGREPEALERVASWLGGCGVERFDLQNDGDLGARMHGALAASLARGAVAALVVASDVPELTTCGGVDEVARGVEALRTDRADLVVGPAPDGGYWLVGVSRPLPKLFAPLPWSTPAVLHRTLERASEAGLRVLLLQPLADVDEATDLERLPEALRGGLQGALDGVLQGGARDLPPGTCVTPLPAEKGKEAPLGGETPSLVGTSRRR